MKDLTSLADGSMWVTSQEGGNLVHDNSPAMTAPGTSPATPMPPAMDQSDPDVGTSAHVPVGAPHRTIGTSFSPSSMTWKVISDG